MVLIFVMGLGFKVVYRDGKLAVIERDGAKAYLVKDAGFAVKDRPEITIETDSIDNCTMKFVRVALRCFIPTQMRWKRSLGAHESLRFRIGQRFA